MSNIAVGGGSISHGDASSSSSSVGSSTDEISEAVGGGLTRDTKKIPPVFTELLELRQDKKSKEWCEIARWMKYGEVVEGAGGGRWGKPHVSTPKLRGWVQLRHSLNHGLIVLDLNSAGKDFATVADKLGELLIEWGHAGVEKAGKLKALWCQKHRHHFEGPKKEKPATIDNLTVVFKEYLVQKLAEKKASKCKLDSTNCTSEPNLADSEIFDVEKLQKGDGRVNLYLQKKIHPDAEAFIMLEGSVDFLDKPVAVFVRLKHAVSFNDVPEVDIPTRFLFFYVSPKPSESAHIKEDSTGVGMSLGAAFTDKALVAEMYLAETADDILDALDDYAKDMKVLPRYWDTSKHPIEPPGSAATSDPKEAKKKAVEAPTEDLVFLDRRAREESGLVPTNRLFGGLINDIKRKKQFYKSDYLDSLHPQCVSSFMFLYFACLAPIVAFGGLLGEATENRIATIESLVSGLISGVIFGMFSGQPLIILGSTGPVYVFEKILYTICKDHGWDYLCLRMWVGLWVAAILLLIVAVDGSAYVCYITRFTEELFAALIALIFIVNAFENIAIIGYTTKFAPETFQLNCKCVNSSSNTSIFPLTKEDCSDLGGKLVGADCNYEANLFLMSLVLFLGTFAISISLRAFKQSIYLPKWIRNILANFAVVISIFVMTFVNAFAEVNTEKLEVPSSFKPTWDGRGWFVAHALLFEEHTLTNPWYVDFLLAPMFAVLATILIFMDQQITAVIVNRKDNHLEKGGGYHLDLLVLSVIIIICSLFGLPWFVAATVLSINHMQSLVKETAPGGPGDTPQLVGIREQRMTAILISVFIGLSTLITPLLAMIPMAVLFGVFFFMGVSTLRGLQFFERIQLFFIPQKHHPNYAYLKNVPLKRVHMFTLIQLVSLIGLWMIKSNSTTSIAFPVMLIVICCIRKLLECAFKPHELKALDDLLPNPDDEMRRTSKNTRENSLESQSASTSEHNNRVADQQTRLKSLSTSNKTNLKKRTSGDAEQVFSVELDALYKHLNRRVKKENLAVVKGTCHGGTSNQQKIKRSRSEEERLSAKKSRSKEKCLIYVKPKEDSIFTPIFLQQKTVKEFKEKLEFKFGAYKFQSTRIGRIFQRNKNMFPFFLDDDMMDYVQPNKMFDIVVTDSPGPDADGKVDLQLIEVDASDANITKAAVGNIVK